MHKTLRRFARRILLAHLALLAVLLAVVFFASRSVYDSARDQALDQAERQQSLLVNQTASGLRGYYDSIFGDLELLKPVNPDDQDVDERVPEDETGQGPSQQSARLLSGTLALQLNGRVSHLFMVQKGSYRVARPLRLQATTPSVRDVVLANLNWIDAVDRATISPLEQFADARGEVRGFNLIGVPVGPNNVLVAAVPVRATARRFFDEVNRTSDSAAFLLDEKMTIMAASRADQVGTQLGAAADPQLAAEIARLSAMGGAGDEVAQPFSLGSQTFAPSLISVQPVKVLDKQWYVLIVTPQSDMGAVVSRLFRRAVLWAIFVALSMTAILVSTAVQLIRSRARIERERHALLEKELKQAREIQLHWLPGKWAPDGRLDIATANLPASRISGDFYNWFDLADGRTVVVIGDVTGHGMAAAFLMATTQLLVRNEMPRIIDPGRCLTEINRQLCTQVFNGQFVTLQILVIDPQARRVEIAAAGHPFPLYNDGEATRTLKLEPNLVLGVERDSTYATEGFALAPGCSILLYTDGAFDAESPAGQRFGHDRLRGAVTAPLESADSMVDSVVSAVNAFRGNQPLGDDLTLVAVQLAPAPAANLAARTDAGRSTHRGARAPIPASEAL